MKNSHTRERGRAASPSERAGEAVLASGERATLYRALRELLCSRCGGVIREGELFTREANAAGVLIIRRCRKCEPLREPQEKGLLDALLTPDRGGQPTPAANQASVMEKVLGRLGPALERCWRGRRRGSAE